MGYDKFVFAEECEPFDNDKGRLLKVVTDTGKKRLAVWNGYHYVHPIFRFMKIKGVRWWIYHSKGKEL